MKLGTPSVENNRLNATLNLQHFKTNLAKTLNSNWLKKFEKTEPVNSTFDSCCFDSDAGLQKPSKKKKTKKKQAKHVCSTPCIPVKLSHNNYKNLRRENSTCDLIADNFLNEINFESDAFEREIPGKDDNASDDCLVQKVFYNSCVSIFNAYEPGNLDGQFVYEPNSNTSQVSVNKCSSHEDKVSNGSSTVSLFAFSNSDQSDSGLSSLNSAQLFFSEIREFLVDKKSHHSTHSDVFHDNESESSSLYEYLANKIGNLDLVR
jgi:hypothetical protein